MGVVSKQSILNFVTSYIGVIIGAVNTVLLFPNIFSASEFGLTRIIVSAAMLTSSLFSFGINNITIKFFPQFKNKEKKHNGFLFFIMLVPFLGYLLFLLSTFIFRTDIISYYSKNSPLINENYPYFIILTLYIIYLSLFDSYLRALHKSVVFSFLDNIVLKLIWLSLIILYYFNYLNFNQFIFGYVNAYGLLVLIEIMYLVTIKEFFIKPNFKRFDIKTTKKIISYGLYTMFGAGITGTAAVIDSLFIGFLDKDGLAGVAFYSVAYYVSFLIVIPFYSLLRIINTSISEAWKNNDIDKINVIYKKSSNNLLIIGMLIFLGIWLNVDSFFQLVPTDYAQAKYVLLFICIAKIYEISVGINGMIIKFSNYFKIIFFTNLLLIFLLISTDYLLIPSMGIVGAALATLFTTFLIVTFYLVFLYSKFKILPFTSKSIFTIIISVSIYLIVSIFPDFNNLILNVTLKSITIILLYVPSIYLFKISPDINSLIDKYLLKLRMKK
ncbi:oligosaccharide flippase family protein [Vicingus serpentipes]|uniref:Oligosaccharide flippase family protein n=1 Tax=Vicingus serpentipes TaxID=1926625 RepID=A0A5C6RSU5_9FLAO|nr:oligosaccharide flippase family protein [Vicingus serpentipes]TXB65333.1 oligosaccharide flippase family protein [Vicingus serpentipes]